VAFEAHRGATLHVQHGPVALVRGGVHVSADRLLADATYLGGGVLLSASELTMRLRNGTSELRHEYRSESVS
jgi:hypothetical protein